MPTLHLSYAPGPHRPDHEALAQGLTAWTAQHLRKRADLTQVRIDAVDPQDWFVGARPLAGSGLAGYCLRLDVSAGTNTDAEMADYLAAVHAGLEDLLGPVAPASYVIVQAQPMSHWGWSGRSQAARAAAPVSA